MSEIRKSHFDILKDISDPHSDTTKQLARRKVDNLICCLEAFSLEDYDLPIIQQEVDILSMLNSPYILQCHGLFNSHRTVYVIREHAPNGTLADLIDVFSLYNSY